MGLSREEKKWINKVEMSGIAGMIGSEFEQKIHLLSKIIGYKHHLTVGEYKERLLRNHLKKYLPSKYKVGTGFVLFPNLESLREDAEFGVSNQIDILVYDDEKSPPLFIDEDLVVVRPESVISIIEVKGMLSNTDFKDTLDKFSNFADEWIKLSNTYGQLRYLQNIKINKPLMYLFAWDRKPTEKGNEVTIEHAVKTIKKYNDDLYNKYPGHNLELAVPFLTNFFCYKDYFVGNKNEQQSNTLVKVFMGIEGKFERESKEYDRTIFDITSGILNRVGASNILFDIVRLDENTQLTPVRYSLKSDTKL